MEPTVVSQAEAKILGVPRLSPALLFERLTYDRTAGPSSTSTPGDDAVAVAVAPLEGLTLGVPARDGPAAPAGPIPGIPPGVLRRARRSSSPPGAMCTTNAEATPRTYGRR